MTANTRKPRHRLRWLIVIAGVLLVAGALGYANFVLWLPMGSGPAGPPVIRAPFTQVWTDRDIILLGLGDSITAGFGASPGHGYFDRVIANPPGEFPDMEGISLQSVLPNMTVLNLAVNGSTSIDLLRDQIPELTEQPPDTFGIVMMTTGGNDLIHMYGRIPPREGAMYGATLAEARPWIANFRDRLDTVIREIDAAFPGGCLIFLANIYDPSDGVGRPEMAGLPPWPDMLAVLGAYNDAIADCAASHPTVHLVDIHATFLGHGVTCRQFWRPFYDRHDPHYWYFDNLEDPNDRGYDAIRRLFLSAVASAVVPALSSGDA